MQLYPTQFTKWLEEQPGARPGIASMSSRMLNELVDKYVGHRQRQEKNALAAVAKRLKNYLKHSTDTLKMEITWEDRWDQYEVRVDFYGGSFMAASGHSIENAADHLLRMLKESEGKNTCPVCGVEKAEGEGKTK